MERPLFKPVGTPLEALDTPSLLIDIAALEHNIETVHGFFRGRAAKLRPHVEAHRCPGIARLQLAAGGTVGGVSLGTVGQAEVFVGAGFDDIIIANQVVTRTKIERLCGLARHARLTVAIDDPRDIAVLSGAAGARGVSIGVLVEIDTGLGRCGVAPGAPAVALAEAVARAASLEFRGLTSHQGKAPGLDGEARDARSRDGIEQILDSRLRVEAAGIEVAVVSFGATNDYDIAGSTEGVSEVPAGAYALMDWRGLEIRPELRSAAQVLTTGVSRPEPGIAITDGGIKAVGIDAGPARLARLIGAEPTLPATVSETMVSAEHGELNFAEAADPHVALGSRALLVPSDAASCANLHDYAHVIRDSALDAVWDITARGHYR